MKPMIKQQTRTGKLITTHEETNYSYVNRLRNTTVIIKVKSLLLSPDLKINRKTWNKK